MERRVRSRSGGEGAGSQGRAEPGGALGHDAVERMPTRWSITVRNASTERVERLLDAYDVKAAVQPAQRELVQYRIATGPAEESPYARQLAGDLAQRRPGCGERAGARDPAAEDRAGLSA